jgi:tetratricopeptide (TPR) repeat protein
MALLLVLLLQSYEDSIAEGGKAYEAGRYAEAAAHFEKAAAKKPTPEAWTALGHAKAALKEGAAARDAYGKALALKPPSAPRLRFWIGRTWMLENDPASAVAPLAEAAAEAETAAEALPLYGQALEQSGRTGLAAEVYKAALARAPSNGALLQRLVFVLLELGRGGEAVPFARSLVAQAPADPEARLFEAQARLSTGDLEGAEAALDAARLLGSARLALVRTLADLRLAKGQAREAAGLYERFLAGTEKPTAEDLHRGGLAYLQGGEFGSAERLLARAAAEGGDAYRKGLVSLARALHERRGPAEAMAALDRHFKDGAPSVPALLLRGELHAGAGRWEEAREAFAAAYARGERGRDFLVALLAAQWRSGRRADAAALLPEALSLHPEHPPLRKLLLSISEGDR